MTTVRLTERERDVLALMAEGLTNRQIAGRLSLEQSTVRWYARQIYARLGAENREAAIARAIDVGLIAGAEAPARPPNNLPAPATPFVGRARELARLNELLADPAVRLLTILGPGGMGKTRLALAAAEAQLQPQREAGGQPTQRHPDGIWFIPLGAVTNARYLAPAFGEALELQFEAGSGRELPAQLLGFLRQKRALLVVDNFEHLVEEAGFLAAILAEASGIQLLVTSRERLQLPGEQVFALDGLAVPGQACAFLASLASSDAAQLFLSTARRVQPDLALSDDDAGPVARICQAVAGMPLGIELAASWVSVLPLGDLAQAIEGSLELLAADWRGIPARHRSMQAALETSWQRLTPGQQAVFQQLCVFRGGFTRPAAYQVAGATLPLLVTLVNKSWLTYDPRGDRYHIHELLRQYGRRALADQPGLEQATAERHSAYYAARLEKHAADFTSGRQREWVTELRAELANLEQAWDWAIQAGNAARIGQGMESLARFYDWMGRLADGEEALRRASERLAGLAQSQPSEPAVARIWARTLIWQSRFSNDPERTSALLEEARVQIERLPAVDLDLRGDRAFLLLNLGECAYRRDRLSALALYELALELYQELGNRAGMAACLGSLGWADWARGHLDRAVERLEASLAIRRGQDDQRGMADVLNALALIRKHQGRPSEAERLHRQVVESYQRLGSQRDELHAIGNLAHTLGAGGKYGEMLELARRVVALAKEFRSDDLAYPQMVLAHALQHHGRYEEAQRLLLEAANLARQSGWQQHVGFTSCWLGQIGCALGDYGEAERLLAECETIFAELPQNLLATPVVWLSYVHRAQGDTDRAERRLGQALRLALDRRSAMSLQDSLPIAALLAADRGRLERAAELHALGQTFPVIANSKWYFDVTGRHLDDLVGRLPAQVASAAKERGQQMDLWQTGEALAAEFTPA